jgi:hypothetical protein
MRVVALFAIQSSVKNLENLAVAVVIEIGRITEPKGVLTSQRDVVAKMCLHGNLDALQCIDQEVSNLAVEYIQSENVFERSPGLYVFVFFVVSVIAKVGRKSVIANAAEIVRCSFMIGYCEPSSFQKRDHLLLGKGYLRISRFRQKKTPLRRFQGEAWGALLREL